MTKNVGTKEEITITYVVDSGSGELSQVIKSVEMDKAGNGKVLYYFYGANHLTAQEEYQVIQEMDETSSAVIISAVEDTYLLYHFNNVGSTTAITDEKGKINYQFQYSPYGELIAGTYGQVAFLYNGQFGVTSDDNGLYYMRARYYNSSIKRFINQDVLIGSVERSGSLNRYAYVEGNPVSYIDPFGMERETVEADGKTWYKHSSGLFLYIPGDKTLKIHNEIAFLSKTVCLAVAYEIVSDGHIKVMDVISVATEIYFHVVMWQISMGASEWDGQGGLKQEAYDFYYSATETDLDDGGDKNIAV